MNVSPPHSAGGNAARYSMPAARPRSVSHISNKTSRPASAVFSEEDGHKTAVKVAVRVRPPLDSSDPDYDLIPHRFRGSTCQVPNPTTLGVESSQGKKVFVFDRVFSDREDQNHVWEYVSDSVNSFIQGYNVSIMAYGQSGAGKSYTMGTSMPEEQTEAKRTGRSTEATFVHSQYGVMQPNSHDQGIVPRAARKLFEKLSGGSSPTVAGPGAGAGRPVSIGGASGIRPPKRYNASAEQGERNWQLKATYVEIYNEQLRDLLVPESVPASERNTVAIREDTKGRIILTGLQQVTINNIEDLMNALNFGSSIRQTDSTAINSKSSRSHAVFSLNLVQKKNKSPSGGIDKRFSTSAESMNGNEHWVTIDSKLHFVDLAGSERLKNSGLSGERVKEGISINAGLASLGKVISQLSTQHSNRHVSYRDSRLTRLLQDSLGGNAITYMVACVNPVEFHLSETLNTVQYAQRARAIQSKPQIQQRAEEGDKQLVIDRLRSEVAFLRDQIRHSERSERRNTPQQERSARNTERENELQNQLLDIQENYGALSQRHAKLISEIAESRGDDAESLPALKGALSANSSARLSRSNNFAEAVELVVLEYEKTIQSLESSLSNTRASLSTSESNLLEREAKVVYAEAVNQQLEARLRKSGERETKAESYLRDLESRLDESSSGEERSVLVMQDLRKELARLRENESSSEEYISTLEERLAEAEQDQDITQREIKRLESVVQRQRSVGKMDGLLTELDGLKQSEVKSNDTNHDPKPEHSHSDMFHDRLVATTTAHPPNGEVHPDKAEEEWKSFGPMEGDEDARSQASAAQRKGGTTTSAEEEKRLQDAAQSKAIADKLETVTMELFDLRDEHENVTAELNEVSHKYQIALNTLAELHDAVDGKQRPSSFLENQGAEEPREDGHHSSSRGLQSDLSSRGGSPTLVNASEADNSEQGDRTIKLKEETLVDHIKRLKRMHAEKDIDMAELKENYSQLQDQHRTTLNYIDELKDEMAKTPKPQPETPSSPSNLVTPGNLRRSVSQFQIGKERENRIFAGLKDFAAEHLSTKPDVAQHFETNISAAMTESKLRSERISALEAELAAVRNEMDVKNTMIAGLSRERSKRSAPMMDLALLSNMKQHVEESRKQVMALNEKSAGGESELVKEVENLKAALAKHTTTSEDHVPGGFPDDDTDDGAAERNNNKSGPAKEQIAVLQQSISDWENKYQSILDSTRASEEQLMSTITGLEVSLASVGGGPGDQTPASPSRGFHKHGGSSTDFEAERTRHFEQIAALQKEIESHKSAAATHAVKMEKLERAYEKIITDVEQDSKSRKVTESELQTQRDLVAKLEKQIEDQKNAATGHQSGLKSLEDQHGNELEELKKTMAAEREQSDAKLDEQLTKHQESTSALQGELTKAHMELSELMHTVSVTLDGQDDGGNLQDRLKVLAEERKSMVNKHDEAQAGLAAARTEMEDAKTISSGLEAKVQELTTLNEEMLKDLESTSNKEKKSSQLVQELEEQLSTTFDQNKVMHNRLSTAHKETERELEEYRGRVNHLEGQISDLKRSTISTSRSSMRDSTGASTALHNHSHADSQQSTHQPHPLRKTTSNQSLPSPPPAIPLPPVPGGNPDHTNAGAQQQQHHKPDGSLSTLSPPGSPLPIINATGTGPAPPTSAGPDPATSQRLEDQEMRIKTIEKHLYAEKQLTQTLEEALTDLEGQANRSKTEAEQWRKKCREVEEEASGLRRERGNMRNSLQAVEEERDRRIRAEAARQQLEARMEALGKNGEGGGGSKKKKGGLNCF